MTGSFAVPDDTICLVPAAVYTTVSALIRELLQRGGAMQLQELFNQYQSWPDLPLEAREIVGETKQDFMIFLQAHPFIFAIFPSKVFVSLHRRLPDFDYGTFLEECFGDQEGSPYFAQWLSDPTVNAMGGANGGESGYGQQQPPPSMARIGKWGGNEERMGTFGANGPGGQGHGK